MAVHLPQILMMVLAPVAHELAVGVENFPGGRLPAGIPGAGDAMGSRLFFSHGLPPVLAPAGRAPPRGHSG